MGNTTSCCFSAQNPNPTPEAGLQLTVASQSHQTSDTPESSSAPSIETIQSSIQEENTTDYIDKLIDVLSTMKGEGEEGSISSTVDCLASSTRSAAQVVDVLSKEAEKIGNLEIISQGLGSAATSVLNAIGGAHFIVLGLSLVAYTLERYMKMKSNDSACKELLETLLDMAKDLKKFKEAVPEESEKVRKAIHEILVGAVNCHVYIGRVSASRRFLKVLALCSSHFHYLQEYYSHTTLSKWEVGGCNAHFSYYNIK